MSRSSPVRAISVIQRLDLSVLEKVHFPLLCLEGSSTVFLHCLTYQSVGETGDLTGLVLCGNHREGWSLPSNEVYRETICDSRGQRDRDMGTVRPDPHLTLR